ncbi:YciI family protein [Oerskovia flava]|uniref:YciI family protein n=1 Tax=Oerskovia flava TaxID=2986422 RepID=UPI00223F29CA|nr:YciI family protein [Oerskovia sp. JB1-3-2]
MKFLLLLHQDQRLWEDTSPAARTQLLREHDVFSRAVAEQGTILAGEALSTVSAATTFRRRGQTTQITEGPATEGAGGTAGEDPAGAEQLGGFYLLDVPDLDVVLELVGLLPEYSIEIRPVIDVDGS